MTKGDFLPAVTTTYLI